MLDFIINDPWDGAAETTAKLHKFATLLRLHSQSCGPTYSAVWPSKRPYYIAYELNDRNTCEVEQIMNDDNDGIKNDFADKLASTENQSPKLDMMQKEATADLSHSGGASRVEELAKVILLLKR